jgi:two-component system, NarL family, response regulator DesR
MSLRLVIAEDQSLMLGALSTLLGLEPDIEVVGQAANGAEALRLARALDPDLVLTDIEMPELSGLDLAAQLAREGARCRVLIVTTYGRSGYLRRALEAGVAGYLLKDTPAEALAQAVRRAAAGERVIAPELAVLAWDAPADPLTDRERDVLRLADEGWSNKKIARALNLSPGTVRNYLSEAAAKLGAANRIEAGRIARDRGWL